VTFQSRLEGVERTARVLGLFDACSSCGWPTSHGSGLVVAAPGYELSRCPECDRFLDENEELAES
jgi:hypothetical protein